MKTTRIATELIHKGFFRVPAESGYTTASFVAPRVSHQVWLPPARGSRAVVAQLGRDLADLRSRRMAEIPVWMEML
jgi:hypothetical protein